MVIHSRFFHNQNKSAIKAIFYTKHKIYYNYYFMLNNSENHSLNKTHNSTNNITSAHEMSTIFICALTEWILIKTLKSVVILRFERRFYVTAEPAGASKPPPYNRLAGHFVCKNADLCTASDRPANQVIFPKGGSGRPKHKAKAHGLFKLGGYYGRKSNDK